MSYILEQERIEAALRRIRCLRRWLAVVLLTYLPMAGFFYALRIPSSFFLTACAVWVCVGIMIALRIGFSFVRFAVNTSMFAEWLEIHSRKSA